MRKLVSIALAACFVGLAPAAAFAHTTKKKHHHVRQHHVRTYNDRASGGYADNPAAAGSDYVRGNGPDWSERNAAAAYRIQQQLYWQSLRH